jgi:hypothetical protein
MYPVESSCRTKSTKKRCAMEKTKLEIVKTPEEVEEKDSLTELLRIGAKALISQGSRS